MKISIKVPRCLNWIMEMIFPHQAELEERARLTGTASRSKRWGNHLASIEVEATARQGRVIYPFRAMLEEMYSKDPVLFDEVGSMPPSVAIQRWRRVYPEDFQ